MVNFQKKRLRIYKQFKNIGKHIPIALLLFAALLVGVAGLLWHNWCSSGQTLLFFLTNGDGANLASEIFGGLLFLLLSLHLSRSTEEKVDRIDRISRERDRQLKQERDIFHFEQFLKNESHHDIRFPDIVPANDPDGWGLEYTIYPVRDENRVPISKNVDGQEHYIVKIKGPAQVEIFDEEDLARYINSPIKDGSYYYCTFVNDSWHLSEDDVRLMYPFYLSGKVGHVRYGQSANEQMAQSLDPFKGMTKTAEFLLSLEGNAMQDERSCDRYDLFEKEDRFYLSMNGSFPKKLYYTNDQNEYADKGWYLHIEEMGGFATGQKLEKIKIQISKCLESKNKVIPKVPGYKIWA